MTQTPVPLLVHIGYHKTATSYLQQQVFTDKSRFCQPWGAQSSHAVEWFILAHPQRFSPEAVRQDFFGRPEVGGGGVPVISHEALSGNPIRGRYYAEQVSGRLHRAFPEARILIGVREQKALLASLYYQYVRQGGTLPVEGFLQRDAGRRGFRPMVRLDHFEYDLMVDTYRTHWPEADILVLPMELLKADPASYLGRLYTFAGLPEGALPAAREVNVKRSNVTMRMERFFNRIFPTPDPRPERYADYPLSYRMKNSVLPRLERLGLGGLGKSEHARINAHIEAIAGDYFAAPNRRLAEMTGYDLTAFGYS